jgi:hypothetical protein
MIDIGRLFGGFICPAFSRAIQILCFFLDVTVDFVNLSEEDIDAHHRFRVVDSFLGLQLELLENLIDRSYLFEYPFTLGQILRDLFGFKIFGLLFALIVKTDNFDHFLGRKLVVVPVLEILEGFHVP